MRKTLQPAMRESDGPRAHLQVLFKHALAKRIYMPRAFKGYSHAHFNASHPQHPALGSAAKTLMCVHTLLHMAQAAAFVPCFFARALLQQLVVHWRAEIDELVRARKSIYRATN